MHSIELFNDDTDKEIEDENIADNHVCYKEQEHGFIVLSLWLEIVASAINSILHHSDPSFISHEYKQVHD